MSNSEYLAGNDPLLKTLTLLKIEDAYKLKLMKFYYKLSYNLLPSYFNYYLAVINNAFPCQYELRPVAVPFSNTSTKNTNCFHRIKCFTSIDTVIKLHTHSIQKY